MWVKRVFCSTKCFGLNQQGKKRNQTVIEKMRISLKERYKTDKNLYNKTKLFLQNLSKLNKGKDNVSLEMRQKIGKIASFKMKALWLNPEYHKKQSLAHSGKRGIEASNWQGGRKATYRKRNKSKVNFWSKQRQLKVRGALGKHTFQEWQELKKKYDYMCLCCKRYEPEIKLTEDHIIPISKGGNNNIENIQPLCGSCNSRKNNKTISFIEYASIS